MANLYPYLRFESAKKALAYYEEVFGARVVSRMPLGAEMAAQFGVQADDLESTTMHAEMRIAGLRVLCSDRFGGEGKFEGIGLMLDFDTEDPASVQEMHDLWARVSGSGTIEVHIPLAEQFWGGWMGQFNDAFGVNWMIHGQAFSQMTP
jgi:PhnB protein